MKTFNFTLSLHGVSASTTGLEDALFEAGCDDATINFRNGAVLLDFDREANSLQEAVLSAIRAVEKLPSLNIKVMSVAPDALVNVTEIARRLNQSRQAISNWVLGKRRTKNAFPVPIIGLEQKSPIWRWVDIVNWFSEEGFIHDESELDNAKFLDAVNAALFYERDDEMKNRCHELADLLRAS